MTVICVVLSVAFMTLAERKVMGSMQRRIGPNKVDIWGILQPLLVVRKIIFLLASHFRNRKLGNP